MAMTDKQIKSLREVIDAKVEYDHYEHVTEATYLITEAGDVPVVEVQPLRAGYGLESIVKFKKEPSTGYSVLTTFSIEPNDNKPVIIRTVIDAWEE